MKKAKNKVQGGNNSKASGKIIKVNSNKLCLEIAKLQDSNSSISAEVVQVVLAVLDLQE